MMTDSSAKKCASTCWYVAVGLGLLLAIILIVADWFFLWALLLGVIVFFILGFVLPQLVCTGGRADRPMTATSTPSSHVAGDPPAPLPGGAPASAAAAAAATPPPMQTKAEPAPQAHPVATKAKKPKVDKVDKVKPAKAKSAPAASVASASPAASSASAKDEKPSTLSAPRPGGADDLKMIKGVGPKLEKMLNGMGFYHFDQIAKWTGSEVAWIDENLQGFKGRATRDDWTGQAATLARGGTTEFSTRASKGGK